MKRRSNDSTGVSPGTYTLQFLLFFAVFAVLLFGAALLGSLVRERASGEDPQRPAAQTASYPTVVLDAGHGGEDGGAVGVDGTLEKEVNLAITVLLADLLRMQGVPVVMTRTEDTLLYDRTVDYTGRKKALDQQARLATARAQGEAIFLSIHMNSFPKPQYHGLQVYYSPNHPTSKTLAEAIQSRIVATLQPENKRATSATNGNIYLLDQLELPAVLVECGFLSNPEECRKLRQEDYQRELAWEIFAALLTVLDAAPAV